MPVSVQETIEQELEHLHHRTYVEEKSLELAVKKIVNNKKYIGTKTQKLEAIKKVGDEMVIGEILYNFCLEVRTTRTISDLVDPFRDAYATVTSTNSLVKLPPHELSQLFLQGGGYLPDDPANRTCPFCSHSYVDEPEENKRLVAKNRVAVAEYKLKLQEYKANGNYKYFNVIVSRYLAPTSMGMDLAFLLQFVYKRSAVNVIFINKGADAISDMDKENIDIGNTDAGKAIASILAMSALEAHNAQVAVVATRNGVSDPRATRNLMKDPTTGLSSLREYAGTAPNIALPGGERNNWLEESTVASPSSNDHDSLPMGPLAAMISPVPPTTTISPSNATALTVPTVLTLQSLGPFDPAPGLVMDKPRQHTQPKRKGPTYKTPNSVALKVFNSVSAAMYGTQRDEHDIIDINDNDSVVSTLSFNQTLIRPQKFKATRNAAISRAGTPVLNMDTDLPSSPDSALGKDVAHFFSLPMAPLRDMVGYVFKTKKDANPEDLKCVVDQVYPFPSSQKKKKKKAKLESAKLEGRKLKSKPEESKK
eukprot:jgi/Psemu1/9886/gm1.9886_g